MNSKLDSSSTIERLMPEYRLRQIDRVRVRLSPTEAWPIVRGFDIYELPISRFLFNLRILPERLLQLIKGQNPKTAEHSRIDDFAGPGKGFQILAEIPGKEITIGAIGKFWQPSIDFANFNRKSFSTFQEDGYGKLAWTLRLDPDSQGGSWLTWELRVTATDDRSWRKFSRYWFVIGKFSHFLRKTALKHFQEKLGSVGEENLKLPGDHFLSHPAYQKRIQKFY